jgi:hypothetical protein
MGIIGNTEPRAAHMHTLFLKISYGIHYEHVHFVQVLARRNEFPLAIDISRGNFLILLLLRHAPMFEAPK